MSDQAISQVASGRHALPEPTVATPVRTGVARHRRLFPQVDDRPRSIWRELPILILIALVVAFLLKTFVAQLFLIPSGSMEPTLQVGDRILVNKLVYHVRPIERGDVVVFDGTDSFSPEVQVAEPSNPISGAVGWLGQLVGLGPPDEHDFVKRVIGVPGDHVVCCDDQNRITVNGIALDEPYVHPGDLPSDDRFDVIVPDGGLWVMGDHRSNSTDSRAHLGDPGGGFVPEDRVIGRAMVVAWPTSHWQVLEIPPTFDQPGLVER